MKFELRPYSIHELGQRQNQEDSIFPAYGEATANDRLFILCDGMGGHEKGEVASATVCETMSSTILTNWNPGEPLSDGLLRSALESAYDALDEKDNGEERKMGTTLTFVCFHANGVTVAHIGDSRVYQLRPATKQEPARIMFRTEDHSLVNDLIKIGEITEEEAKHHPQKNVITRAMQPCQERRAKADVAHLTDIREGDYFYMCSDGMLEIASDEEILALITNPEDSDEEKIEKLIDATKENRDNHTAHLINVTHIDNPNAVTSANQKVNKSGKNKILYAIVALFVVVVIALASHIFLGNSKSEEKSGNDTITVVETPDSVPAAALPEAKKSEKPEKKDSFKKEEKQKQEEEVKTEEKTDNKPSEDNTSTKSNALDKLKNSKKLNPNNQKVNPKETPQQENTQKPEAIEVVNK